jgi:hypothetical protein
MNVCVIGYRNHAKNIIDILIGSNQVKKIYVFLKKKKKIGYHSKKIEYIYNLKKFKYKIAFILSPSNTHYYYINILLKQKCKIFCEKPVCTKLSHLNKIEILPLNIKKKIFFNFNLRFSPYFYILKKKIEKKKFFKEINFFHGHSGKKITQKTKDIFSTIRGNLGVHYINFILGLTKKNNNIKIFNFKKKNKNNESITLLINKDIFCKISLYYTTPTINKCLAIFENYIIEMNNGNIFIAFKNNKRDNLGKLIPSKSTQIYKSKNSNQYINNTLNKSVNYALKIAKSNRHFSLKDFEDSVISTKLILKTKNIFNTIDIKN